MERFVVGKIVKQRGLKGEVKVMIMTDFPESFKQRKAYFVGKNEESAKLMRVVSASLAGNVAYLRFAEITTPEEAEALKSSWIYIEESELMPLEEGKAYQHQLIGLDVFDDQGVCRGKLSGVFHMPASDVYEVESNGQKVLIPAIEEFLEDVDLVQKKISIRRFDEFL
ncbi:MAG: 16S rRNA processing protein RimM [Chlorobiales bacterium]|jgi:16S rRNA processing protein RimM|nr:16S rRNA processing protein RimM [Chlorobiales bacterium]